VLLGINEICRGTPSLLLLPPAVLWCLGMGPIRRAPGRLSASEAAARVAISAARRLWVSGNAATHPATGPCSRRSPPGALGSKKIWNPNP